MATRHGGLSCWTTSAIARGKWPEPLPEPVPFLGTLGYKDRFGDMPRSKDRENVAHLVCSC